MERLKEFKTTIWENTRIEWNDIHPDVNIIVGINGKGKTTLLEAIYEKVKISGECIYVRSVDNLLMRDKRRENRANALTQELEYYFYDTKIGPSLMKMRADSYDSSNGMIEKVKEYESKFIDTINALFSETKKKISLKSSGTPISLDGKDLPLSALSSGEKQMLLVLLQVNLLMGREAIVLIDEPENSMHISWQSEFIKILMKLNPNAQYFITTHSPSIYGDGWGYKITYIDQLIKAQ